MCVPAAPRARARAPTVERAAHPRTPPQRADLPIPVVARVRSILALVDDILSRNTDALTQLAAVSTVTASRSAKIAPVVAAHK